MLQLSRFISMASGLAYRYGLSGALVLLLASLPTLPSAFDLLRQVAGMLAPLAAHHARALSPVIIFASVGLRVWLPANGLPAGGCAGLVYAAYFTALIFLLRSGVVYGSG